MRWCYKTVHFEQKKEGLLGNAYIDELEIEETLNEFGKSGWELVSMLEVRDGVIAVFKQLLDEVTENMGTVQRAEDPKASDFTKPEAVLYSDDEEIVEEKEFIDAEVFSFPDSVEEVESAVKERAENEEPVEQDDADVGSIRIE